MENDNQRQINGKIFTLLVGIKFFFLLFKIIASLVKILGYKMWDTYFTCRTKAEVLKLVSTMLCLLIIRNRMPDNNRIIRLHKCRNRLCVHHLEIQCIVNLWTTWQISHLWYNSFLVSLLFTHHCIRLSWACLAICKYTDVVPEGRIQIHADETELTCMFLIWPFGHIQNYL